MSEQKKTVVVLGAGPAGLAAAYTAQKAGHHVIIIERSDIAGGKGGSRQWKDFVVDFGPHAYHAMTKEITDFMIEHAGGEMIDVPILQRLYITDKPMGYPFNLREAATKFSLWLNFRILWDYFWVKFKALFVKMPQNSFKQYGIANFGRTLYDICFGLYSERVWGCSADKLSVEFARRKLPSVSLGSFIFSIIARKKKENKKSYLYIRRYLYHKRGIGKVYQNIADGIAARGGQVIYSAAIRKVVHADGKIRKIILDTPFGTEIEPDWVVSTIPLDSLLEYLSPSLEALRGIGEHLPFRHGVIVNVVVNRAKFDDPHWMYLVNKRFYFNRVSEPKNFSPLCGPKDQTLLMLEKICAPNDPVWNWDAEAWRPKVEADLGFFGIKPEEIGEIFLTRMDKAFPFYLVGYEPKKNLFLENIATINNLVTTGRYGLFLDINMHDAMVLGIEGFKHLADGKLEKFYKNHEDIPLEKRMVQSEKT
jgi:protoporphyrinogen oxidase